MEIMKRLSVFVHFILLALFLLNSFVLKEKYAPKSIRNKQGLLNHIFKSTDGGETWQPNNAANKVVIDSIWRTWNDRPDVKASMIYVSQVGENLVCVHRDGIFKSSDNGKTWKLLLPSVKDKIFNLVSSGNVIYAITSMGGC
jgi:photosystem II stability/assembly factor-like uncharacterized protein